VEREEVPMSIVGGLDIHRKQLTFDYVEEETDGRLAAGRTKIDHHAPPELLPRIRVAATFSG
jgi:hypothetical protein